MAGTAASRWRPSTTTATARAPASLSAAAALVALAPDVQVSSRSRTEAPAIRSGRNRRGSGSSGAGPSASGRRTQRTQGRLRYGAAMAWSGCGAGQAPAARHDGDVAGPGGPGAPPDAAPVITQEHQQQRTQRGTRRLGAGAIRLVPPQVRGVVAALGGVGDRRDHVGQQAGQALPVLVTPEAVGPARADRRSARPAHPGRVRRRRAQQRCLAVGLDAQPLPGGALGLHGARLCPAADIAGP